MMLDPAILALVGGGALIALSCVAAAAVGVQVLRGWDLASGSERQVQLERRTYLVSTILVYVLAFEIASLFLFVLTADQLHRQFTGAMCAAGSLYANAYGYPALVLKLLASLVCGWWLVLNHADRQAPDYPLIRRKYALLQPVALLIVVETGVMIAYFASLRTEVITSCCGLLFGESEGVGSELASLPPMTTLRALYAGFAAVLVTGLVKRLPRWLFALLAVGFFGLAMVAVVSVISLYVYALPTHHCPFCLLQAAYRWIGYPLYLLLLGGAIAGGGVGVLSLLGESKSLREVVPGMQRSLGLATLLCYGAFMVLATWRILASPLKMR